VDSDEVLVQAVRSGDITAFDRLYLRHETRLFAYLRALLRDRSDAEEVLHDAFLSALHEKSAVFDREGAFRAWLYRVARNLALNRKRAAGRRERTIAISQSEAPTTGSSDRSPDLALESRQLEQALAVALGRLPEPMGELWHLRSSGLSYEQIASVTDVPLGTVKSRIHQMVGVLREELKPWIAPE
jgi:RNA polymerase sigma-70 factor (ECF subfamily)